MIPCYLLVVLTIITFNVQASQTLGKRKLTYDFVGSEPESKRACLAISKKTAFVTKNTIFLPLQKPELRPSQLPHLAIADVLSHFTDIHLQPLMAKIRTKFCKKFTNFFSLSPHTYSDKAKISKMVGYALEKAYPEITQSPQALADIMWLLIRSAALKKYNEYTENALLQVYARMFGYCDIFTLKNDKNQNLLEYATTVSCPLLTKTLLQFNADIKNAVLERTTTISDQEIIAIKERCQNPAITDLLTNVYRSRRGSGTLLKKNYIRCNRLHYQKQKDQV